MFLLVLLDVTQSIKDSFNSYLVPLFAAAVILGVLSGFIKNFKTFNDPSGDRRGALLDVGLVAVYVTVGLVVITALAKLLLDFKVFG